MIYRARRGRNIYGEAIGVILLDGHIPYPPGCPGNATSFDYPVRYEVVRGVSIDSLKTPGTSETMQPFVDAGMALAGEGVGAITGNCGLMITLQRHLASALPVPVFMSSLLQIPFVASTLGPGEKIGVIASSKRSLNAYHLKLATGGAAIPLAVASMDGCEGFQEAVMLEKGTLDFAKVEAEVISVISRFVADDPAIKALVFECTDLPPYAHAVQQATALPVFDITTMMNFMFGAVVRKSFEGYM